jgi:hypothetical protein
LIISISFLDISDCFFTILCKGSAEYHEEDSLQEIIDKRIKASLISACIIQKSGWREE